MGKKQPIVYAVRHKDETIRENSRSGGIFTALSDLILKEQGVVYGCILTEDFEAIHVRTESVAGRDKMRGSKYIQSRLGDTYKKIKNDLAENRWVLFSGTSCQVAGLQAYVGEKNEKLICVDIVCHGVPSPKVWKSYLKWQEGCNKAKVVSVDFRDKQKFGWRDHAETIVFDNKKIISSRIFRTIFYSHHILRPSCYECPYKSIEHPGNITIADYWGIEKAAPEFDDNKGVSLVLINDLRGQEIFEKIKNQIKWKQTKIEDSMQHALIEPYPMPNNRKEFWKDFKTKEFKVVAKKYGGYGAINVLKGKIKKLIK